MADNDRSFIRLYKEEYLEITTQCIQACKRNEPKAQKELYVLLVPYLNALCSRYLNSHSERSDVLQDSFIRIFTKIDQYSTDRGAFKSWAAKILINTCLDYNRKSKIVSLRQVDITDVILPVDPSIVDKLNNEALLKFIQQMPDHYYTVFNLFIIDGFSHKEIAALLDIDQVTSRKRLSRARTWLQERLTPDQKKTKLANSYLNGLL